MAHIALTKISIKYKMSVNDVKRKLVSKKVCRLVGQKAIPLNEHLVSGMVKEFPDGYSDDSVYYKYDSSFIDDLFPKSHKKKDNLLFIRTYKDATTNIKILTKKLINEETYFHTFKYEIERSIGFLKEEIATFSKIDKKRVEVNIEYLELSKAYQNKDFNDFIY